jgi:hypothetical protein
MALTSSGTQGSYDGARIRRPEAERSSGTMLPSVGVVDPFCADERHKAGAHPEASVRQHGRQETNVVSL